MTPRISTWMILLLVAAGWGIQTGRAAEPAAPPTSPAAWWKFDEASGRVVEDASGHGRHGTIHGTPRRVAGVSGSALAFDGQSYVEVPFDPQSFSATGFTIQAFVRPSDSRTNTYKHLVDFGDSCLLRFDSPPEGGQLSFFTFLSGNPEPRLQAGVPAPHQWHQIVAAWDGRKLQLWLDGVKRERDRPGTLTLTATPLTIGRSFVGDLDDLRLYDRALTESEIWSQIPPKPRLSLRVPHPVLEIGKPFAITGEIANAGGQPLAGGALALALPPGLALVDGDTQVTLPPVERTAPQSVNWTARADAAIASEAVLTARFEGIAPVTQTARCVVARPVPAENRVPQQAELTSTDGDLILANPHLRLVFPTNDFGYGVFAVDVNQAGTWTRMALADSLSHLTVRSAGIASRHFVYAREYRPLAGHPGEAGIEFRTQLTDGAGTRWDWRFRFHMAGDDRVRIEQEAVPDQDGFLLHLQGPMLRVGEGTFGARKDDALFCGLEWLVKDEASSSNLDMHDPNHYIRFVPHPNKITVPLMALTKDGTTLALYWDGLQRWDGTHPQPAAIFASPNFVETQDNCLMGLFLPSVPEWVAENQLEASTRPYPFKRQVPLRLEWWLAGVDRTTQSVDAMPRWFQTFGVPEPAPLPRGDYRREIEFSMRAFLESLWIEAEQRWWTSKGAGELLSPKGLPPAFAAQLRMAAALTQDPALQTRFNERATLTEQLGRFRPQWDDLGFIWSCPSPSLAALVPRATGLLDSADPDGAWRFRTRVEKEGVFKGMDYALLGPDQAVEVGTCARNAYDILRLARLTGDADLFRAGQRSLRLMSQFSVPRAAQVWECPVHAPDILAAADAIDAYLEAYRYSLDAAYRQEAVRWAWRGLPFVYVWNPPGREVLRYASIAIFGGSWYAGSWIGQPVQWNGLRYAYALLKLADCDDSFPWRKIAEGITISAMYQQDDDGPNVALWPDNFSAIDWSKCPWVFEPGAIFKNVLKLIGHDIEPTTTQLSSGADRAWITTRAAISDGSWGERALRFVARFPESCGGYLLIAGIERPTRVVANELALPESPGDLASAGIQGWEYEPGPSWLVLKLSAAGPHRIELGDPKPRPSRLLPRTLDRIDFEFDDGLDGWMAASQVEGLRVDHGKLIGHATGGDPYLQRSRMKVDGDRFAEIRVRLRTTAGDGAAFFWVTEDRPDWSEDQAIHLGFHPGAEPREIVFAVGTHPSWAGKTITGIRLDPIEGGSGGEFEVEYLRGRGR